MSGYVDGENEAVDSLDTGRDVEDAGGGGFVRMDDGSFVTIDCTVPRADPSMLFSFVGTKGKLYLNNDDGEWRYWRLEDGEHVESPLPGIEGAWTWEGDYKGSFANAPSTSSAFSRDEPRTTHLASRRRARSRSSSASTSPTTPEDESKFRWIAHSGTSP